MATSAIKSQIEDISANLTTNKGTFVVKQAHRFGRLIVIAFEISLSQNLGPGNVFLTGIPSPKGRYLNIPVISGGTTKIAYTDGGQLTAGVSMSTSVSGVLTYVEA